MRLSVPMAKARPGPYAESVISRWSPAESAVISATTIAARPEGTSTVPAAPEISVQAEPRASVEGVPCVP